MKQLSSLALLALVLAGCTTVITAHQLDEKLGPADPGRYDAPVLPVAPAPDYRTQVRPILDRRCVSCHACYDSPCQLNLSRYDGITRGARPDSVYSSTRLLAAEPTRLGLDAHSNEAWREKGFFPVLNERSPSPEANLEASVLYRILGMKQQNPGPRSGPLPAEDFSDEDLSLDRSQMCPRIESFDSYMRQHPQWGMPYGLPALSAAEHETLSRWIEAGAPPSAPAPLAPAVARDVAAWEALLNGNSPQAQLAARYIFEHWYIGHLYFEEHPGPLFELVRSRTAPGQPIDVIATRRPYDDPEVARVYYRLRPLEATPVAKTFMPLPLGPARMARLRQWFFDAPLQVQRLPGYDPKTASNPFATFHDLPVDARYRFMLDDARFTLMGFMKGPVCRGQVALNVINDHFWVIFLSPEGELARHTAALLEATQPNLRMPAEDDRSMGILAWHRYARGEREYLKAKAGFAAKLQGKTAPRLADLWDGDGHNPTAGLTVFRHFDSASVIRGLAGDRPQTTLLLGYPLFERMHYLLVAGFDVYGNVGHQLSTRLYMDFLRMEGEQNFLTFLPLKERQKVLDQWYRGKPDLRIREFADAARYYPGETGIRYRSSDPLDEFYRSIQQRLKPVREARLDFQGLGYSATDLAALQNLNRVSGLPASRMPELSLVALEPTDRRKPLQVFSLVRNSAHSNVAELFREESRRLPAEDRLLALDGFAGAYPNLIFRVSEAELPDFAKQVAALESEADLVALVERYGVRRTNPRFWPVSDAIHAAWQRKSPREAAILDYSRLDNL